MRFQSEVEQRRRTIVGVNDFVEEAEAPVEILKVGDEAEQTQRARLARLRERRDAGAGDRATRGAAPRRGRRSQHHSGHAGLRACVLHAVRDPACAGGDIWQLSRAGLLLTGAGYGRNGTAGGEADRAAVELPARLTAVEPGRHRVVTCYLKLEPRDRSRGKYLIKLKNRVKDSRCRRCPGSGSTAGVQEEVAGDLERIQQFLRDSGRTSPRPRASPSSRARRSGSSRRCRCRPCTGRASAVDASPRSCGSSPRWRTSSAGSSRSCSTAPARRFFEVTAYDTHELPGLRADSTRGKRFRGDERGPGWGEHTYHNRIRTEKQRHFEAIARELFTIDRRHPAHGIVLAGTGTRGRRGRARFSTPTSSSG